MPVFSYSFVMPPTIFIVICLLAALVALVWRWTGVVLMLVGSTCLYLSALPVVSDQLSRALETELRDRADLTGAGRSSFSALVRISAMAKMSLTRSMVFPSSDWHPPPVSTEWSDFRSRLPAAAYLVRLPR